MACSSSSIEANALAIFFEVYLIGSVPFTSDVISFFIGKNNWQASIEEFKRIMLEKTNKGDNSHTAMLLNYATNFIDWVLATHFSQKSDNGKLIYLYANPFEKVKSKFDFCK